MKRRKLPKYVSAWTAGGRTRYQFRRKGYERYYFRNTPWSDDFMEEYRACMAGKAAPRISPGLGRATPGSFSALISTYYGTALYGRLRGSTRATYRREMERLRAEIGDDLVKELQSRHVAALMDRRGSRGAANNLHRALRVLMRCAVALGWRDDDPTRAISRLPEATEGFHTWTEDEVARYEAVHPPGSQARRAMTLALYTGQRRSDLPTLGRQHVRDGRISVRQAKTSARLEIPIHPRLADELVLVPAGQMTFLQSRYGRPFTKESLGNRFREWCDEAGLPQCSLHGLRKLMAVRLAEAGCSAPEIAAVTGHKSLREVQRYIRAAEQKTLSGSAMERIGGTAGEQKMSPIENGGDNSTEKANKINGGK